VNGGAPGKRTLAPVKIASVGTTSGVMSAFRPGAQAVQVWAQWTNSRGGLAGHPVEVVVADDGGDPARYRALLQQLVERDRIIAIVYSTNWLSAQRSSIEYLEQRRVPVIGGDKLTAFWLQSPMLFPDASANTALIWNHMVEASRHGKKKVGWISCADLQLCRDTDMYWGQYAPALGLEVAYRGQVSFSQPDFTTECLQARNAGVEVFMLAMDATGEARVASSCARQGYHPIFLIVQTSLELHRQPALDGAIFASYVFPFTADDTPAAREFQAVMKRYGPGVPVDDHSAAGWTSARLFERAAAGIGEEPTSAQILDGLWSLRGETLGGLTVPLTFERDRPAPMQYGYFPMTIRNGRWEAPQGSQIVSQRPKG
jgi:branched-chain amino acid transport system substrate-binding protein